MNRKYLKIVFFVLLLSLWQSSAFAVEWLLCPIWGSQKLRLDMEMAQKNKQFSLKAFESNLQNVSVTVSLLESAEAVHIRYKLGLPEDLGWVLENAKGHKPQRKDELWCSTCFEFFWPDSDGNGYSEMNVSPSGDWQVYHFESYREGRTEATVLIPPRLKVTRDDLWVEFEVILSKNDPLWSKASLGQGVPTLILNSLSRGPTHWATSHPKAAPDFHLKAGSLR